MVQRSGGTKFVSGLICPSLFIEFTCAQAENTHSLASSKALNENLLTVGEAYRIAIDEGFSALLYKSHLFNGTHVEEPLQMLRHVPQDQSRPGSGITENVEGVGMDVVNREEKLARLRPTELKLRLIDAVSPRTRCAMPLQNVSDKGETCRIELHGA
jgi:hypothetical protein